VLADGQTHRQTQTDFIICPMLYAIAMGQITRTSPLRFWKSSGLHGLVPRYLSDYIQRVAGFNFQQPPSTVVVILAAIVSDPTYTVVCCRRSCTSGGWKPPPEQSVVWRHLSSNADFFSEPPQNSSLISLPIISFLTVFGLVLYTVYSSGLAVLYLIHVGVARIFAVGVHSIFTSKVFNIPSILLN